ncbi:MAG TPA: AAA family ATPase [Bacteroidia bacterium]|nr:AAA family ATPase [Bacteroidia bacterium]
MANSIKQSLSFAQLKEQLTIKAVQEHAQKKAIELVQLETGPLSVKTANGWMRSAAQKPLPEQLLGELWYEDEICMLFADTNVGKSILAVQIADTISKGKSFLCFPPSKVNCRKVLYLDFELSERQFFIRYKDETNTMYTFSDHFYRAELNPDNMDMANLENPYQQIIDAIVKIVEEQHIKIIIIDNITYLRHETENAKNALPLMQQLKQIKKTYNLSMLILAHTPKRDTSRPISSNDLAGSRALMNFADSAFSIGVSQRDNSQRYIKQIKVRNTSNDYCTNNVLLCDIVKENALLQFNFVDYADEGEHLKQITEQERTEQKQLVYMLSKEGKSQRQIAAKTGLSLATVNRYLKKVKGEGGAEETEE